MRLLDYIRPVLGLGQAVAGASVMAYAETQVLKNLGTGRTLKSPPGEARELLDLYSRIQRFEGQARERREALCARVVAQTVPADADPAIVKAASALVAQLIDYEGHFHVPEMDLSADVVQKLSTSEVWERTALLKRRLAPFENPEKAARIEETLEHLLRGLLFGAPAGIAGEDSFLFVPLMSLIEKPAMAVESVLAAVLSVPMAESLFPRLWKQLERNALLASGIDPLAQDQKEPIPPTSAAMKTDELVNAYLWETPFSGFLQTRIPFSIPYSTRFEHTHVLGGSGHGKTQLLQSLILRNIEEVSGGRASVVVIDSQGDMIRTIMGLAELSPSREGGLAERLVLIDPNDVECPPCLNLFDFGLKRLQRYSSLEREKLINGAIALYEYMFGALLGAELTARQGVIFRYLARLLMVVPGATIHTLRGFMEQPEAVRADLSKLDPMSRHFFESQFFSKAFDDTRQQILTRLWAVLSNAVLARMFSHRRNKLDLFEALNRGSLIFVNTAKDLLKQEGCEILGRFFISMISQAAQERAAIDGNLRRPTFVYVDEAQDYFDESLEQLLNQARKYKVGLVLAHQNLGQFETRLQAAVMSSTAIKLAGGVSAHDATALAKEMRCEAEFLQGMRKRRDHTEFACFIRNVTERPVSLSVPLGQMEARPRLSEDEREELLARNRERYCEGLDEGEEPVSVRAHTSADRFEISEQEVL